MITRTGTRGERGFALVAVMFVMVLLLAIAGALHTAVMNDTSARASHLRATNGFYAAESGINRGMGDYRNVFLSYNIPSDFSAHTLSIDGRTVTYQLTNDPANPYNGIVVPAGRLFAGLNAIEYRYKANSNSQLVTGDTEASIGTQFNVDYIAIFQFLAFFQGDLEILPGANALFHGPIHTNGNLYLNSDATLTIADCLAGGGAGQCPAAIPVVHLSAGGNVYRGRKDTTACNGTVQVAKLVDSDHNGALDLQTLACTGGATAAQSSATLSNWLGAILAKQPVVAVPAPGILARGTGDYWIKADLRIVLDLDSRDANHRFPIVAMNSDGSINAAQNTALQNFMIAKPGRVFYTDVPEAGLRGATTDCSTGSGLPAAGTYCHRVSYDPDFVSKTDVYACPGSDLNLYPGCAKYIANDDLTTGGKTARRGGFYNNREGDWVYLLNVNAHDLLAWNRANAGVFFDPANNNEGGVVIFLSVKGPNSTAVPIASPRYGVRVFGSPNLDFPAGMPDPTGLSVMSDQAIYVEGDYNTGGGACTSFAACPKMPAAFMGDALNVLSSGWTGAGTCRNDCQSFQALASRAAASTAINAGFIAGVDVTTAGNYNGGLENYPRFHEDWSGDTLTYRGSFVSLGAPLHSNGRWCGTGTTCNIYNPPTRNWDFDTDFQNASLLPPMTPRFVTVQQIQFTENFR